MSKAANRIAQSQDVVDWSSAAPDDSQGEIGGQEPKPDAKPAVSGPEAEQLRQEKLAAIRRAIDAGQYDSDDLLEESLKIMLDRLDEQEDG
jgi:anti-sigma28 factor (negative regulator of flagellin synthesis)